MMASLVIPTTQAITTYSLQITTDIPLTSIQVKLEFPSGTGRRERWESSVDFDLNNPSTVIVIKN
jgi:hypothetical protein